MSYEFDMNEALKRPWRQSWSRIFSRRAKTEKMENLLRLSKEPPALSNWKCPGTVTGPSNLKSSRSTNAPFRIKSNRRSSPRCLPSSSKTGSTMHWIYDMISINYLGLIQNSERSWMRVSTVAAMMLLSTPTAEMPWVESECW